MVELMRPILKWIERWEKKASYGGKKAIVNLGASVVDTRARQPDSRKDGSVLDVRVPPTIPMAAARRDIQRLFFLLKKRRDGAWNSNLRLGPRRAHQRRA